MSPNIPVPIPLGSSLVNNAPAFDRWGLKLRNKNRLDHRDYKRRAMKCDVWLTDVESQSVLRCCTDDVSDAGFHATAPIGFGLAVGQRYELRMARTDTGVRNAAAVTKSLGYATIIRTEIEVGKDKPDRVGFAIRFDVPQLLPLQ
jgi:hypothetical protein